MQFIAHKTTLRVLALLLVIPVLVVLIHHRVFESRNCTLKNWCPGKDKVCMCYLVISEIMFA